MADYPNGGIPPEALTPLSVGGSLLYSAAASFERWRTQAAAAGRELTITSSADAYRSFDQQHDVFTDRYKVVAGNGPYNDVRMYNGQRYVRLQGAAAAVPGTSNHGRGIAIDVANAGPFGGSFHNWLSATGPALGWTNDEGRSVNEPWHWVHVASTTTPTPPTSEEDDMFNDNDRAALKVIFDALTEGQAGVKHDGEVIRRLKEVGTAAELGRVAAVEAKTNTGPIRRNGVDLSLRQEIADTKTSVLNLNPGMQYFRVATGTQAGDIYEVGPLTSEKLTAQQFEDIKSTIEPRMQDISQSGMTRLVARKAALRTQVLGR